MLDLKPIKQAVRQAAEYTQLVRTHAPSRPALKAGAEPVTLADYGAQAILGRALLKSYPDDGVFAEESAAQFLALVSPDDRAWVATVVSSILGELVSEADLVRWLDHGQERTTERMWTVDPVDGTRGFIAGRRYAIAVGVLEGSLPVAGLLGCPGWPLRQGQGVLFSAQRGAAWAEVLANGKPVRVAVLVPAGLSGVKVVESIEEGQGSTGRLSAVLSAAGLSRPSIQQVDGQDKYAMLAAGEAQVYLRFPNSPDAQYRVWDHAAGVAVVHAAGGAVTDFAGTPLDFSYGRTLAGGRGVLATAGGSLHERLLEAVSAQF